jgi:flagellar hook-basal body complex protein FliE
LSIAAIGGVSTIPMALATPSNQATGTVDSSALGGFGALLKSLGESSVNALRNGESTAMAAIDGKASIQNAVMATMEAEQSLQVALSIRDKVVSAFLEISRLQI